MLTAADFQQTFAFSPWSKLGLLIFSREAFGLSVPFFEELRSTQILKLFPGIPKPQIKKHISITRKTILGLDKKNSS